MDLVLQQKVDGIKKTKGRGSETVNYYDAQLMTVNGLV